MFNQRFKFRKFFFIKNYRNFRIGLAPLRNLIILMNQIEFKEPQGRKPKFSNYSSKALINSSQILDNILE